MASYLVRLYALLETFARDPRPPALVMAKISQAVLAALRSLSKSTFALRQMLKTWLIRVMTDSRPSLSSSPASSSDAAAAAEAISPGQGGGEGKEGECKSYEEFALEIERLLGEACDPAALIKLSEGLRRQLKDALVADPACMLPLFNYQLPSGKEKGTFLALDVGGSTFRVSLVELRSLDENGAGMRIVSQSSYKITNAIKQLEGVAFFDWMAIRIKEALVGQTTGSQTVLSMGLSWSFPIEQTSLRSGLIQGMGKGFLAAQGLLGHDLGDVIQQACERHDLKVELKAIVNDGAATLLTKAYTDPSTRFGLILGTGVNAAVHLPVAAFGDVKFGVRPASWHAAATHVLVNTEFSMFGNGVLPLTRWDVRLNREHVRPGFQPFEHLVSGRYLGEIARLILLEGIESAHLFDGVVPLSLRDPYTLDTELLANIQSSPSIGQAQALFAAQHPSLTTPTSPLPSEADVRMLQRIARGVTSRASAILAAGIHSLWQLRIDAERQRRQRSSLEDNNDDVLLERNMIACNGSVVQSYPGFRAACQRHLDALTQASGGPPGALQLTIAVESSLLGAAVAVACIDA
ncbi:MAG: hypothetical protein M1818_004370 [Claussenomyces sp. TS43310]|nr:MAG: hypothetical protein M1818_004370 [Claussenomyces sp. TS43310]